MYSSCFILYIQNSHSDDIISSACDWLIMMSSEDRVFLYMLLCRPPSRFSLSIQNSLTSHATLFYSWLLIMITSSFPFSFSFSFSLSFTIHGAGRGITVIASRVASFLAADFVTIWDGSLFLERLFIIPFGFLYLASGPCRFRPGCWSFTLPSDSLRCLGVRFSCLFLLVEQGLRVVLEGR